MSMCRVFSCVVGRGCLLWPVHFLGKTLLVFALLNSVCQGQICLLLQVFLDFLLLHSSPLYTIALISHASKVMLKILQARLQQYVNRELPDVHSRFRKCRGTRDQIANIRWSSKKQESFRKNIYFCFIDYAKAFDCVDHNKLWKILKEMGIPDHLTCLFEKSVCRSVSNT